MMSSSSTKQGGDGKGMISDNNENSSASAYLIGGNIDILTLILVRLPSKSLLVFKSVSKQFLCMITDPQFIHKHFLQNPKFSIPGVFWGNDCVGYAGFELMYNYISFDGNADNMSYLRLKTLNSEFQRFRFKVLQSCNGLLLFSTKSDRVTTYYVFNPFTNKCKVLPPLSFSSDHYSVSLAFDPFKSPYYKVIAIWIYQYNTIKEYKIEMYNSELSSWRFSGFYSSSPQYSIHGKSGVFWNGSLYWGSVQGSVFYFDVDRESVGEVALPSSFKKFNAGTYNIAEYQGHLYLIGSNHDVRCFSIFEMDASNSSWNFIGQVDVNLNPYGWSTYGSTFLPERDDIVFIIQGGEENESTKVVLLPKNCMVVSYYDLKDRTFTKIFDLSVRRQIFFHVNFYQNIESLAWV